MGASFLWSANTHTHTHTMFQIILASTFVAVSLADSPPAYAAPAPYKPAPVAYKEEVLPPQPFAYEYGVNDDYSKSNFKIRDSRCGRCCFRKLRYRSSRWKDPDHQVHC